MNTETRWDLTVRRNDDVWERPLRIIGPNLTGVDMRAQIRLAGDTPGAPLADLQLVTNGNAEGVRLASAIQQADGTWSNDVRIRLNKSTRQAFPYSGELGDTAALEWGFLIGGITRIQGPVFVPAQVYGSDNAPLNRPPSYGARSATAAAASSGATLTISQDGGATLKIDGADLLGPMVAQAEAARDAVKPLQGMGPPDPSLGIDGSTYYDTTNPDSPILYGPKQNGQWGTGRALKGNPGGNVMAVGLRVDVGDATTIPDGVGVIQFAGFRQNGQGAHQMFLWQPPMASLDPAGEGFWWITTNGGAKTWFISADRGSPEMLGAYADDGQYALTSVSKGTDDWVYLKKAVDYFNYVDLPGKYRSSKCINVLRAIVVMGQAGVDAGNYTSRVRFDRGCVGWFFHRRTSNADDTGKIPFFETRALGADGFVISNIEIVMGEGNRIPYNGSNLTEHAVWHKCRGLIQNLRIIGAMGHGVYGFNSATSTDPMTFGNANSTTVNNVRGENLTGSPLWWQGTDMNAGSSSGINASICGGPAICEMSLLGNAHYHPHAQTVGRDGTVNYGGFRWWCLDPTLASTQQPGTGAAWFKGIATANADDWVSGKPYFYGASYVLGSATGRNTFENPYTEGGSGPLAALLTVDTQNWIDGGLLNGDGAVTGNLGWLGLQGIRINGRNGYTGASYTASDGLSGLGRQATLHNTGEINATRGSSLQINVGYEADRTTPHQVGRYAARSGANTAAVGEAQIDLWNPGTSAWDTKLLVQSGALVPGNDNTISLGSATRRFSQIYAGNATINTSDERTKRDIAPIDDALLDAWVDVEWRQFVMADAAEAKGDDARIHTGLVAQQVRDALEAHGVDGTRYGLLCVDRWGEEWVEWGDEYEERETIYAKDENGNFIIGADGEPEILEAGGQFLTRKAGRELVREAGEQWGIRYTEAFAVEAAYRRRRLDRIEARLASFDA